MLACSGCTHTPTPLLLLIPPAPAVTATNPTCRELQEESGLTVNTLHKVGHIVFEFVGEPELMDVHIFCTESVQGTPMESDGECGSPSLLPTPAGKGKPGPGPGRQALRQHPTLSPVPLPHRDTAGRTEPQSVSSSSEMCVGIAH